MIPKEVKDRYSPFLKEENVYVQINKQGELDHHRYKYELTGYNAAGKKKNVLFTASTDLPKGTYLKVLAKGYYSSEYEEVNEESIPKEIKW